MAVINKVKSAKFTAQFKDKENTKEEIGYIDYQSDSVLELSAFTSKQIVQRTDHQIIGLIRIAPDR
jgi:hypothetical protein